MKELDLHGIRHNDVQKLVDHFLYENVNNIPVKIITGYSNRMQDIVINILKEYNYDYEIGDGFNMGYIKVI